MAKYTVEHFFLVFGKYSITFTFKLHKLWRIVYCSCNTWAATINNAKPYQAICVWVWNRKCCAMSIKKLSTRDYNKHFDWINSHESQQLLAFLGHIDEIGRGEENSCCFTSISIENTFETPKRRVQSSEANNTTTIIISGDCYHKLTIYIDDGNVIDFVKWKCWVHTAAT